MTATIWTISVLYEVVWNWTYPTYIFAIFFTFNFNIYTYISTCIFVAEIFLCDIALMLIFSPFPSRYHLYIRTPEFSYSWKSIIECFNVPMWIAVGVTWCILGISIFCIHFAARKCGVEDTPKLELTESFLQVLGNICLQGNFHCIHSVAMSFTCVFGNIAPNKRKVIERWSKFYFVHKNLLKNVLVLHSRFARYLKKLRWKSFL